jgi:hypothetical protein
MSLFLSIPAVPLKEFHIVGSPQGYNNTETIAFELEVKCVAGQAFRDIPMCKLGNLESCHRRMGRNFLDIPM